MVFQEYGRDLRAWTACNSRLLAVRLSVAFLSALPGKLLLLRAIGWSHGLVSMARNRGSWPGIIAFAMHIKSPERPPAFIKNYFVTQSQCRVFASYYYEAPGRLGKYVTIRNYESLAAAVAGKKGAILLGAHFGPVISAHLLAEKGLDVRGVFGRDQWPSLDHVFKYGLRPLMRKKWLFYANVLRPCTAGRHERQILNHLRQGGVAFIMIDMPRTAPGGSAAEFLGAPMRFNDFAFKLAAKYDVPVYFHCFDRSPNGYTLTLKPVSFLTAGEGVKKYAAFFEEKIARNPSMWRSVPIFSRRLPIRNGARL